MFGSFLDPAQADRAEVLSDPVLATIMSTSIRAYAPLSSNRGRITQRGLVREDLASHCRHGGSLDVVVGCWGRDLPNV